MKHDEHETCTTVEDQVEAVPLSQTSADSPAGDEHPR